MCTQCYSLLQYHLFDKKIWDSFTYIWLITFWSSALFILVLYKSRCKNVSSKMAFWKIIEDLVLSPLGKEIIMTFCDKNTRLKIIERELGLWWKSFHFYNPPQDASVCAVLISTTEATPCLQPKLRDLLRQYHCF